MMTSSYLLSTTSSRSSIGGLMIPSVAGVPATLCLPCLGIRCDRAPGHAEPRRGLLKSSRSCHQGYQLPAHLLDGRVNERYVELGLGCQLDPRGLEPAGDDLRPPGTAARTWRAPARSISSSEGMPDRSFASSGALGVPYLLPENAAHSSSSPLATIRSKRESVTKWYSRPSTSPRRGGRVVTDTESHISGQTRASCFTTVLLPTPDGPDSTVRRAPGRPGRMVPASPPGAAAAEIPGRALAAPGGTAADGTGPGSATGPGEAPADGTGPAGAPADGTGPGSATGPGGTAPGGTAPGGTAPGGTAPGAGAPPVALPWPPEGGPAF